MSNKRVFLLAMVLIGGLILATVIYYSFQQTVSGYLFSMIFQTIFAIGASKLILKSKPVESKKKKK